MSDEIEQTVEQQPDPPPSLGDTMDRIAADIAAREPVQGPDGKFQPKVVAAGAAPEGTEVPGNSGIAPPDPVAPVIEAPQSLPADVKDKWTTLSPDMQAAWAAREGESHKKITADGERLKSLSAFEEVLSPFSARLQQVQAPPAEYVRRLAYADTMLANDFDQGIAEIYRMYGRDPRAGIQPGMQPDPNSALAREVTDLRSQLNSLTSSAEQTKLAQAQQQIDAIKKDMPHFDEAESIMTKLYEPGEDLKQLYGRAIKAHPTLGATIEAEAKAAADKTAADEAKAKAAKDAKISTLGRRPGTTPTAPIKGKTIWETLDKVAREVTARE